MPRIDPIAISFAAPTRRSGEARPTSLASRPRSISTTPPTLGSHANSRSNIARCSTRSCPLSTGFACQCRLGEHRTMSALKWLMAWAPFNVTEDADLGMRLARSGYRCTMVHSTTYEEAPPRLSSWLRQRTRWLKGYVQTWLVHMRSPRRLWRELGPLGFLGFQTVVGHGVAALRARRAS